MAFFGGGGDVTKHNDWYQKAKQTKAICTFLCIIMVTRSSSSKSSCQDRTL